MKLMENEALAKSWNLFILNGDLNALSQVYFFYYDFLFDYGVKHTEDRQLVEDAIQNVFLNLIMSRKNIHQVKNLTGYLISSCRRQLFADASKQKRTLFSEHLSEDQFNYFKSPDQTAEHENKEHLHQVIEKCVGNLTPRQQEILFLRFEKEISYAEIAEMLDISVDSCYKLIYRTVKMIRSEAEKILNKEQRMIFWLCLVKYVEG